MVEMTEIGESDLGDDDPVGALKPIYKAFSVRVGFPQPRLASQTIFAIEIITPESLHQL